MKGGVYKLTNIINNKIYIGSTCCFKDRKSKHKNKRNKSMISRAIFKYGWNNFTFEILEYCDKEFLLERENYYFDIFEPFSENNGYNILRVAKSNGWLNHRHTDDTKKLMSDKKKGCTPWNKGKMGVQICSIETKELMSKNRTGEQNSFYGKSHSEETIKKLREIAKDRDMSIFNKKVIQMDKITNDIIKIWDSISDASEAILGDRKSSRITAACKGRYKTAGGFCWRYDSADKDEIVL